MQFHGWSGLFENAVVEDAELQNSSCIAPCSCEILDLPPMKTEGEILIRIVRSVLFQQSREDSSAKAMFPIIR